MWKTGTALTASQAYAIIELSLRNSPTRYHRPTGTLNAKGTCHNCIPSNPVLKGGKKADKVEREKEEGIEKAKGGKKTKQGQSETRPQRYRHP